ncbi:MAG: GNAT family N-acetyltransferase [Anaerolineae bacterium]
MVSVWDCRPIQSMGEFEKIVELEIAVWGLEPKDAVPSSLLHAMATNGSLVAGAYDGEILVGLVLAFPVIRDKQWMLWSHMTGTHPDYQNRGIGFALKQFQRTWAIEKGYKNIGWTFDPLQRGNANFNLHQLGATANTYLVDFYGEMTDSINAGLPSDRLEVIWNLQQARVKQLANGSYPNTNSSFVPNREQIVLTQTKESMPRLAMPIKFTHNYYLAQIPNKISDLKHKSPDIALQWRLALREVLENAFVQGYIAQDFVQFDEGHFYLLGAPRFWYMYVLECSDRTLYTGVTPNLLQRLEKHNKGRGAAYTAARLPVKMIGAWCYSNKTLAMRAEYSFKKLARAEKLQYLATASPFSDGRFIELGS